MTNNINIEDTHDLSAQIEGDLIAMLDEFHSLPEVWDDALDKQIAKWYAGAKKVWPKRDHPYFSPSSVTKCPLELYHRSRRAKKDVNPKQPHQSRWQKIGTVIGDMIQREILAIERNLEKHTGNKPRFVFERNEDGTPLFEDFSGINKLVEHNGERFYLYGFCDGIMKYTTDSGETIRVGLEIKSKQQNPGKTSVRSMREAQYNHVAQTDMYAYMYDVDYYVVLYQNASKRDWDMTDEEYASFPDIRAFCRKITDVHRKETFDKLALVTKALRENKPPTIDLDEWKFNDYKTTCALSLTDEEYDELVAYNERYQSANMPAWRKRQYADAIEFITNVRKGRSE